MSGLTYDDTYMRDVLKRVRSIAAVGMSANDMRPSYFAMLYLQSKGYRVVPINPRYAGQKILGETVLASLDDLPEPPDMVQIFRKSKDAPPIVEDAIRIGAKVLWMQLGVRHDAAAERARQAGLDVVMDRCPKIEYGRLFGEIGWAGVNRRVISSKKGQAMQLTRVRAGFGRKPASKGELPPSPAQGRRK
jgi:predicted CoA-binding protein